MIVDNIAVTYLSLEQLIERQIVIEKRILDYLQTNPIADSIQSTIRIHEDKYILNVTLIKEEVEA